MKNEATNAGAMVTAYSAPSNVFPQPRYAIIDLGTNQTPRFFNNAGAVVLTPTGASTYTYWSGGSTTTIPLGTVYGMNTNGVVIGTETNSVEYQNTNISLYLDHAPPPLATWTAANGLGAALPDPTSDYIADAPLSPNEGITAQWQGNIGGTPVGIGDDNATVYGNYSEGYGDDITAISAGFGAELGTLTRIGDMIISTNTYQSPITYPPGPVLISTVATPGTLDTFTTQNGANVALGYQETVDGSGDYSSPTWVAYDGASFHTLAHQPRYIASNNDIVGSDTGYTNVYLWPGTNDYASPVTLPNGISGPINCQDEIVSGSSFWQSNQVSNLYELISPTNGWTSVSAAGFNGAINDSGAIVGTAISDGSNTNFPAGSHGVLLPPCDSAPNILRVNSNFDEQKINGTTGYAQPDNYDEDLTIASGPDAGQITVTDLNQNFFGVKPGTLPSGFYSGATVTIKKLDNTDPETGQTERGTIRLYAIQNLGQSGEQAYPIPISNSGQTLPNSAVPFTTSISTDDPANLVSVLYSASPTIPQGSTVTYWMEGVDPGPITLEYRIHNAGGGNVPDVVFKQHFSVCTQQSKAAWQQEIQQEVLLEKSVNISTYSAGTGFLDDRPDLLSVYSTYQELFDERSTLFPWGGTAKLAGCPVYAGLSDAEYGKDLTTAATILLVIFAAEDSGFTVPAGMSLTTYLNDIQTYLIQGNIDIYSDLAWQFVAYRDSGIWALRYDSENGLDTGIRLDMDNTWENVWKGDWQTNSALAQQGNYWLLRREQQQIVQSDWDDIAALPGAAFIFSELTQSPLNNGLSFEAIVPGGNITNYDDRWAWINATNGLWLQWNALSVPGQQSQANQDLKTRATKFSILSKISTYFFPIY